MTGIDNISLLAAANLLQQMGATQVYVFGSLTKGRLRPESDVDIAVRGLPPDAYFTAVSKASDILRRNVDLVDLDDPAPLVLHLINSGELVRVG